MNEYKGINASSTNLLDAHQVAAKFGMRYEDVIRMATAGEIPSIKIGRRRRFPEAWLALWIDQKVEAQGWKATGS